MEGKGRGLSLPEVNFLVTSLIIGHIGDESFQSITCTGTDNLTRTTKRLYTETIQNNNAKMALVNSTIDTLREKSRLRDRTNRAKRSGSILSTRSPHGAANIKRC